MTNLTLETPTITTSTASSNVYNAGLVGYGVGQTAQNMLVYQNLIEAAQPQARVPRPVESKPKELVMPVPAYRLVQVFIADTNVNIPLDKMLMYKGDPTFTDLTDQELFHEIDIKTLLEAHNEVRVKIRDKGVRNGTVEHLEPVRIRDLKMVVTVLCSF